MLSICVSKVRNMSKASHLDSYFKEGRDHMNSRVRLGVSKRTPRMKIRLLNKTLRHSKKLGVNSEHDGNYDC